MLSIDEVQDSILDAIKDAFSGIVVEEQAIPDSHTVPRDTSGVKPYIALQFGDLQEGRTKSMAGPRGDDYYLPVYVQAVASKPRIARKMANKVVDTLLGASFEWSGSIRKRPGGGMWPIVTSDGATEAYQFPASFSVLVQYHSEP